MALTPSERRTRRDERAQAIVNPDTGQPFRNYNQLDTWQRNQKAKQAGFKTRSQARYQKVTKPLITEMQTKFPDTFSSFLDERPPTETLARQFKRAFGTKGPSSPIMKTARKTFSESEHGDNFDWRGWRTEYASL